MNNGNVRNGKINLYYEDSGSGELLVLISGLGMDLNSFAMQVPALSQHFRVVTFDNRDSGRSSQCEAPYNITDMANDVIALLDHLGAKTAIIVGHSMGGVIAQQIAIKWPERVSRLVLVSTMADFGRIKVPIFEPAKFIKKHDETGEVFAINSIMTCMTHKFLTREEFVIPMLQMLIATKNNQSVEAFSRQIEANNGVDLVDKLGQIKAPTLILVGDEDVLTPASASRILAENISNAALKILPDGAHGAIWEIPDKVNEEIINFLK